MLVTTLLTLTLTFTPDASRWSGSLLNQAPKKKTLALPGLLGADVSPAKMDFFTSHFATALMREGLQVTAAEDIAAVIGLERQKQLMGCNEGAECMAEIASALGADALITGRLAKLGDEYGANIKILDAKTGKAIALFSGTATNEAAVLDLLTLAAKNLVDQLRKGSPGAPSGAAASRGFTTEPNGLRRFGKYSMITGGILLPLGLGTAVLGGALVNAGDAGGLGSIFVVIGVVELISAPGIFVIGLVCYLIGEDVVVPAKQAILRRTPFEDVGLAFVPARGGGTAALAFRF